MNMLKYIVIAILCAVLCSCSPARPKPLAQPEAVATQGTFTHDASGMAFPLHIGEFERSSVRRNDTHGLDVSVRYELISMALSIAATVDIHPAPPLDTVGLPAEMVAIARENAAQQSYEVRRREFMSAHPGTVLVQEGDVSSPQQGDPSLGRMAVFEYEDVFYRQRQVLRSQLHLFCFAGGEWIIRYQFTYPKNADALYAVEGFMMNLPWTLKKPKQAGSRK